MNTVDLRMKLIRRRRSVGVTLVEILIVVAIMAMIASGVAFAVLPQFSKAQLKTAKQGALEIRKVSQLWQMDNPGDCPHRHPRRDGLRDRGGGIGVAFPLLTFD